MPNSQVTDLRYTNFTADNVLGELPDREVLLGCARPPGMHRRVTDAYAVMAGLDGIAFPADGTVAVAHAIGRPAGQEHACCSIKTGRTIKLHPMRL